MTCLETDTFWEVVKKLVIHEVHGLVVVNAKNVLRGVITLSDVLQFMVLRPIMEVEGEGEQSTGKKFLLRIDTKDVSLEDLLGLLLLII